MPLITPLPPKSENWAEEEHRALVKTWLGVDVLGTLKYSFVDTYKWLRGDGWRFFQKSLEFAITTINDVVVAFTPLSIKLAAHTINQIAGTKIDADTINTIASEPPGREQFTSVGAQFRPVIDGMFPIDYTAQNTVNRADRSFALDNVNAYFGTNLLFQLRSLTIATIASFVPEFQLRHLEGLHQTINWAFGFGWLSWSVMSSIMDVTTTKPLQQHYNKLIKPNDLTEQRAIQANLAGLLGADVLGQIFDNEGLRDDIRQISIALQEKDLSDSQLETLWEEQQIDEAYLTNAFRLKSFGPERAGRAVSLVKQKRYLHLRDEGVRNKRRLFVDCVIDEQELRLALTDAHYTQQEADKVVSNDLDARRFRQFMGTTDMFKAVKLGLMDLNEALTSLQCRGWTWDEAVTEAILRLQDHLPACDAAKLEDKALISLLQAIGTGIGINGKILSTNILKYLQCLDVKAILIPPIATLEVSPSKIIDKGLVTVKWTTLFATEAHLTPGPGPVPVNGDVQVEVKKATGFTLVASNLLGKTHATAFVDWEPSPPAQPA